MMNESFNLKSRLKLSESDVFYKPMTTVNILSLNKDILTSSCKLNKNIRRRKNRCQLPANFSSSNIGASAESNAEDCNHKRQNVITQTQPFIGCSNKIDSEKDVDFSSSCCYQFSSKFDTLNIHDTNLVDSSEMDKISLATATMSLDPDIKMTRLRYQRKSFNDQQPSSFYANLIPGDAQLIGNIESDSFTETFTPVPKFRRRRLIKRMIVDSTNGTREHFEVTTNEFPIFSELCMNKSVRGVQHSKKTVSNGPVRRNSIARVSSFFQKIQNSNSNHRGYSESSMDYDLCSCTEWSDSDSGHGNSDNGHQGDDEHSDCNFDHYDHDDQSSTNYPSCSKIVVQNNDHSIESITSVHAMLGRGVSKPCVPKFKAAIEPKDIKACSTINAMKQDCGGGKMYCVTSPNSRHLLDDDSLDEGLSLGQLKKKRRREVLQFSSYYSANWRNFKSKSHDRLKFHGFPTC